MTRNEIALACLSPAAQILIAFCDGDCSKVQDMSSDVVREWIVRMSFDLADEFLSQIDGQRDVRANIMAPRLT